jgi:malonyl-CoA O-methyltransferase
MPASILLAPAEAYALWAADYPPHAHNPVMLAEERAMLSLLPQDLHGHHILDAGCGSGRYLLHAQRRHASRLTGVDLSPEMLARARSALHGSDTVSGAHAELLLGSIDALPVDDGCIDLALCGLVVGHVRDLRRCVAELGRATRPGGTVLCSDVHPIGHALGWVRDFKSGGQRYAVHHTQHLYSHWHDACASAGLRIDAVREPMLDPADIPPGARFDPAALESPVALVLKLRREH